VERDDTRFVGTELDTVELLGEIDRAAPIVAPIAAAGVVELAPRVELSVVFLLMRGLRSRRIGWPRFDYGEVLWRVGARRGDESVWVAARCDLDSALVRVMARRWMRYDTRASRITIAEVDPDRRRLAIEAAEGAVAITVTAGAPAPAPPSRPLLVDAGRSGLPWHERAVGATRAGAIEIDDGGLLGALLGPDARLDRAIVYAGRDHACGVARPLGAR